MKKNSLMICLCGALLLVGACSKDSVPDKPGGGGGDSTEVPEVKDSVFVLVGRSSPFAGSDVLYTAASLDSGEVTTVGTGIEQDGASRNYITNNGLFFSLLFNQGNPGAVTAYKIGTDKKLQSISTFQTESITAYGNAGEDVYLFKNAWQPEEQFTQWYRVDTKSQEIASQGEIDAEGLTSNGSKAFFTDFKKVGDKLFTPFWSIESGQTFKTAYPDSNWIAVYSYPDMKLEKVIRDGRTGAIGGYAMSGIDVDEKGDTYVFGTKLDYDQDTKYSTKTPVAVMRINSGTTEYDKSYFLNISDASGGQYIYKKSYLGKGYFLLTMCPKPYVYATVFYGALLYGGIQMAVINVYDGSFKWVTGLPDKTAIQSTTNDYNYSALDGTGYIGIYYTEDKIAKSTVYKIDGPTASATAGLVTDGRAAITGIFRLPVSE